MIIADCRQYRVVTDTDGIKRSISLAIITAIIVKNHNAPEIWRRNRITTKEGASASLFDPISCVTASSRGHQPPHNRRLSIHDAIFAA
ncbi:hypothetical protein CEXT_271291 [Caerostris extrusa]|uniref:Uncharacterized protein n=1 Tax=Caerostris extrusa TaxID=172846 RepID=A0AAV4MHT4_CAEEX|nr:hypothetical protein CEXT_271291 [Caerostris extrusa]